LKPGSNRWKMFQNWRISSRVRVAVPPAVKNRPEKDRQKNRQPPIFKSKPPVLTACFWVNLHRVLSQKGPVKYVFRKDLSFHISWNRSQPLKSVQWRVVDIQDRIFVNNFTENAPKILNLTEMTQKPPKPAKTAPPAQSYFLKCMAVSNRHKNRQPPDFKSVTATLTLISSVKPGNGSASLRTASNTFFEVLLNICQHTCAEKSRGI